MQGWMIVVFIVLGVFLGSMIVSKLLQMIDSRERLLQKFDFGTWEERKRAIRKLKYKIWYGDDIEPDQRIIQALTRALRDRDWRVRKQAVHDLQGRAIPMFGDYAIKALSDKSEEVRQEAAIVLGKLRQGQSVNSLINALRDESISVRREAAIALGKIPDIRVIGPLLDALGDHDVSVQKRAAAGLKKACSLIQVIVFGNSSGDRFDARHAVWNPHVSQLTVPMRRLNRVIIDTAIDDCSRLEQFMTYAVNVIGQRRLKKHVEVHLYGAPEKLHSNLRNSLTNLCKRVHAHETL